MPHQHPVWVSCAYVLCAAVGVLGGAPPVIDQDCIMSGFGLYSTCTGTCGGGAGTQSRSRTILVNPTGTGAACPAPPYTETIACTNTAVCPVTPAPPTPVPAGAVCTYTGYSPFGVCDATCGTGTQTRTRSVITNPFAPAACPDPLTDTQACVGLPACPGPTPAPVVSTACTWSAFSLWSGCPANPPCGNVAVETRSQVVVTNPTNDPTCLTITETRNCAAPTCAPATPVPPVVCEGYTGFSLWSTCSVTCGTGTQTRTRTLVCPSCAGAALCTDPLTETQNCNTQACNPPPVDCVLGAWQLGLCSIGCCVTPGCGGGYQYRTRPVVTQPTPGGLQCDKSSEVVMGCNSQDCIAVDCVVSAWGAWGACDRTCGDVNGARVRTRTVTTDPLFGGLACPVLSETSPCSPVIPQCDVACTYGAWSGTATAGTSGWTPCTVTCGGGTTFRQQQFIADPTGPANTCDFCDGSLAGTTVVQNTGMGWNTANTYTPNTPGIWTPLMAGWLGAQFLNPTGTFCIQTEACNAQACLDVDCLQSDWSTWTECSQKCRFATTDINGVVTMGPAGVRMRTRYVLIPAEGNGIPCGLPQIEEVCNDKPCDVDCLPSTWTEWSACSGTCWDQGAAIPRPTRTRTRTAVVVKQFNGRDCGPLSEDAFCDVPACNQPCVVDDWTPWTQCDKVCGGGQQARERKVIFPSIVNGVEQPCGLPTQETRDCNTVACRAGDCEVGSWGIWGPCYDKNGFEVLCATDLIPGGTMLRSRKVTSFPSPTGLPCPILNETKTCNTHTCARDCVIGNWTEWSACSLTCGGGSTTRTRQGDVQPLNGGIQCPVPISETNPCNTDACSPNDCQVGEWSEWTACGAACGGGEQKRTRDVVKASLIGSPCPALEEWRMCNTQLCPQDCQLGGWSDWSQCSVACGGGKRDSIAFVLQPSVAGGKECDLTRREEDCNTNACKVGECVTSGWTEWDTCSRQCGGGIQGRTRSISSAPTPPNACPALEEARECNVHPCPSDCIVGEWSGWDLCSVECGPGITHRWRPVLQNASGAGSPCPTLFELDSCNNRVCPPDTAADICKLSAFSAWGTCDAPCGGGLQDRTRSVVTQSGNVPCPTELKTQKDCNQHSCPTECSMSDWTEWSQCSVPCNGGVQIRRRWINVAPSGADPCPHGDESRVCNQVVCASDACRVSSWSSWGACSAGCGGNGVQARTRTVVDTGDGNCPSLEDTIACNREACDSDCSVSDWQTWSLCSATCGGGTQTRIRWVIRDRLGRGKVCPVLIQRRACNEDVACLSGTCSAGVWQDWTTCTSGCNSGSQTRTRTLPTDGSCPTEVTDETRLCNLASCGGTGPTPVPGAPDVRSASVLLPLGVAALCSELNLEGALSTVRAGDDIVWTTTSSSMSLQQALGALQGKLSGVLNLPEVLRNDGEGTYVICLQVGVSEPACEAAGIIESTHDIQAVMEGGPKRTVMSSSAVHLHVYAKWHRCFDSTGSSTDLPSYLTFSWKGLPTSTLAGFSGQSKELTHPSLHLPAGSLPVGEHLLRCEVCAEDTSGSGVVPCKTALAEVIVSTPPLVAGLARNNGTISAEEVAAGFSLDASSSYDPAALSGTFEYAWTCTQLSLGAGCPPEYPTGYLPSPQYKLPTSLLAGQYIFGVSVRKGLRVSAAQEIALTVIAQGEAAVALIIQCNDKGVIGACRDAAAFDPTKKLSLYATTSAQGSLEYSWKVRELPTLSILVDDSERYAVIPAGTFALGKTYNIVLSATTLTTTGETTLVVTTVAAPIAGTCEVSPKQGEEMNTLFSISCSDWQCPDGSLPSYRFEVAGMGSLGAGFHYLPYLNDVMLLSTESNAVKIITKIRCNTATLEYSSDTMTATVLNTAKPDLTMLFSKLYAAVAQGRMMDSLRFMNLAGSQQSLDSIFSAQNLTDTYLSLRQAPDTAAEIDDLVHTASLLARRFGAVSTDSVIASLNNVFAITNKIRSTLQTPDRTDDLGNIALETDQRILDLVQASLDKGVADGRSDVLTTVRGVVDGLLDVLSHRASPGEARTEVATSEMGLSVFQLIQRQGEGTPLAPFSLGWNVVVPYGFSSGGNALNGYTIKTALFKNFPYLTEGGVATWSISVDVFDLNMQDKISTFGTGTPIRITTPIQEIVANDAALQPAYFDELDKTWKTDGMTLVSTTVDAAAGRRVMEFDALHTTFFAGRLGAGPGEVEGADDDSTSTTLIWVALLCVVLFCCSILAAALLLRRRQRKRKIAEAERKEEELAEQKASTFAEPPPDTITHNPIPRAFPTKDPDISSEEGATPEASSRSEAALVRAESSALSLSPGNVPARVIDVGDE